MIISVLSIHNIHAEIKALSGEPAYNSVNLTWTVDARESSAAGAAPAFTVYYCEMQPWGAHRCKSKAVADNRVDDDAEDDARTRQYATTVGKLRMATKYMFHVKLQATTGSERKASGRADLGINEIGANGVFLGQSIVIPTKGCKLLCAVGVRQIPDSSNQSPICPARASTVQAHATKCLPHASEIEVETGPHFGGRIVAEGGGDEECGIAGDERSARDRYVMRIDHERCGSQVDHEQLTVRTFITVQENLGIFTHSTRRFVVVCSYQPDTLTVRASFSVPGKAGVAAVEPHWEAADRSGRQRKFRMVGKDALVLREPEAVAVAEGAQTSGFRTARRRVDVGDGVVENLVEDGTTSAERSNPLKMSKYARLVHDEPQNETGKCTHTQVSK